MYRDLKPENILLGSDGHIKLADFNLSKIVRKEGDQSRTICGTPEYIAPEIITGKEIGKEADLWSFGVLLFEMLDGQSPFKHKSHDIIFKNITRANYFMSFTISEDASDLIKRLLKVSVAQRMSSVEEIKAHQFFRGVDWEAVRAKEKPTRDLMVNNRTDMRYFRGELEDELTDGGEIDGIGSFEGFSFNGNI